MYQLVGLLILFWCPCTRDRVPTSILFWKGQASIFVQLARVFCQIECEWRFLYDLLQRRDTIAREVKHVFAAMCITVRSSGLGGPAALHKPRQSLLHQAVAVLSFRHYSCNARTNTE